MNTRCKPFFSLATGWRHSRIRIRISATVKRPLDEDVIHPAAAAIHRDADVRLLQRGGEAQISRYTEKHSTINSGGWGLRLGAGGGGEP